MLVTFAGITNVPDRPVPLNAWRVIVFRFGAPDKISVVKLLQFRNAALLIPFRFNAPDKSSVVRFAQFSNADLSMLVTLAGMVNVPDRPVPLNAWVPIVFSFDAPDKSSAVRLLH